MSFWSDYAISSDGKGFEPKRKHTFLLSIAGKNTAIQNYLITKVKKPSFTVKESTTKFLNHTFNYPGALTWEDVTFSVIDVVSDGSEGGSTTKFMQLLQQCGYKAPAGPVEPGALGNAQTLSKLRSVEALGRPIIRQIDADGRTVEEWVLHGAWISKVEFGDLDYKAEDLMEINVTIKYDFAHNNTVLPNKVTLPSNAS